MEHLPLAVIGILLLIIAAQAVKIALMRRSAREILEGFEEKLAADTNTLLSISSRDASMRALAAGINAQLKLLRKQRHRYLTGDRELKEAVTNISHDLRTPLTAICGYMELLAQEEKSEDAARYLALIAGRTEAMKQLTEELFRYSVIISAGEPALEPLCLNSVLEESIAAFYGALTQRGIEPEISICEERVERTLDRGALSRVFSNILNNAVKYSDGDLEITLLSSGEILFANRAAGLSEVQVGRLFDRFFSVEAARHATGLGLAIAKTLVERMNGFVGARYKDGRLCIRLLFPEG